MKLYSATEASRAITFNMLHKGCGSRLKQQYICVKEEVVVPREDIVKGYEFAKDQYVTFTPEEMKAMEEAGTHMAEITELIDTPDVDAANAWCAERPELINEGYMSVSVVKTGVAAKAPSKAAILKAYVSTLEGLCVANGIAYERPAELDEAASSEASDTATDTTAAAA